MAATIEAFVDAQRAKRAERGLAPSITDGTAYRIIEGLLAGRRTGGGQDG